MTVAFLVFALLIGWLAWNLYHPVSDHGVLAVISFFCGWLTGELAIHHILWQVPVVVLFVWSGAVEGLPGTLGFLVCIAAWIAMGYFYAASNSASLAMHEALTSRLGAGYESDIHGHLRAHFPDAPDYARIRRPWGNVDAGVELIKDRPFGDYGQTLDIYRPRDGSDGSPVLLQIHGGAWTEKMGSKERQAIPLMNHMALRNWICVANSYRLSPGATFPDHLVDCKQALVWVKQNIKAYGGNPDFIAVTGGSAGGHLCALMALTQNDPAFQPGFEDMDTGVEGAVPFYGVYDFTNELGLAKLAERQLFLERSIMKKPIAECLDDYRQASPLCQISEDAPPFLIVHGDKDSLVPVEEARFFAEKLSDASNAPVIYAEIPGGQHAFDMFPSLRSEHVKHGVERFLSWLYSRHSQTR